MGQKVSPVGFRTGITKKWKSNWFAGKDYPKLLQEDIKIRELIFKKLHHASVADVLIERSANLVTITVYTSRPGVIIGRSGAGIEELRSEISKITPSTIKINIEEVREPELSARLVALNIASQLERRISYRRACKQALGRVINAGARGAKIQISGRLGGVDIARQETFSSGSMPLATLRSDIDYAYIPARTTYGVIGVKVWIYKGEIFEKEDQEKE